MEQARFWMWARSKSNSESNYFIPSARSWEEEAFAEDATGPSGAFIWPPRSYNCSFCGREFKSAQALGGHMNVHRRDRARLKQASTPERQEVHHQKNYIQSESRKFEYPNQSCTVVYNTDDISANSKELFASSLSSITASASLTQGKRLSHGIQSMVFSTIQDHQKKPFHPSHHPTWSDPASLRTLSSLDSKTEEDYTKKQNSRTHESDVIKPDLPVSLNLAIGWGNNEMACCKRRRSDEISLPFFLKATAEDLDLELRLGDKPKVK